MLVFFRFIIISNVLISLCLILSLSFDINKLENYMSHTLYGNQHSPIKFDSKNVLAFFNIPFSGSSEFQNILKLSLSAHDAQKTCQFKAQNKVLAGFELKKIIQKLKKDQLITNKENSTSWSFTSEGFSRKCGLSHNLHQLKLCVYYFYSNLEPGKDYYFLTMIRHPVKRFISEWTNFKRDPTWFEKNQLSACVYGNYSKCLIEKKNMDYFDLDNFLTCEFNITKNRQTSMLAHLENDCDYISDEFALERAKQNLENLPFFAIGEFQFLSQKLFEKIFMGFKFLNYLPDQNNIFRIEINGYTKKQMAQLVEKIEEQNLLDMELYKFAVNLFFKRLNYYGII